MKFSIGKRIKLLFAKSIDEYFKKNRRLFVPVVKGGMYVDHDTALSLAAVFSAVRYVAESVASLPWELRERRRDGGSDPAFTHGVYRLIHSRPNPNMGSFDWRVLMVSRANLWGNAYAEIIKDTVGRPLALWPITPDRVTPKRNDEYGLYYEISQRTEDKTILFPDEIFHLRGLGDELEGYSVVSLAARTIGAGLASDEFLDSFYANGIITSGVFRHPKSLSDKAYDRLKAELKDKHGGPHNAFSPFILEDGTDWQSISMPLKDAQFLESRKFTVNEIARWFRVPPHKIADLERATFSNIEEQNIDAVQEAVMPWVIRIEQETDYKLISDRAQSRFFSKLNAKGLLRGDSSRRAVFYQTMRNMGAINADEIRDLEDMNPIGKEGGGEKYVIQGQYRTLDQVGEVQEIPPQLQAPVVEEEEEDENINATWRPVLHDALLRIEARRKNRWNDSTKSMTEEGYKVWLPKFINEQANYMIQCLRPSIIGYAQALGVVDFVSLETYLNSLPVRDAEGINQEQDERSIMRMIDDMQGYIKTLRRAENAVIIGGHKDGRA